MRSKKQVGWFAILTSCLVFLLAFSVPALADDFADYGTPAGQVNEIDLPEITGGWFDAIDYFPDCSVTLANNANFELKGRMLLVNNKYVFIQKTYNASGYSWGANPGQTPPPAPADTDGFLPVAYLGNTMDPTALKISPDGTMIALIPAYMGGLYVFPSSILNTDTPVDLDNHAQVTRYTGLGDGAYDMEWVPAVSGLGIAANRYLATNEGTWPGPPYGSGVYITDLVNLTHTAVMGPIDGASASVTVDRFGNIYSGNGCKNSGSTSETGDIRVAAADDWWTAYQNSQTLSYLNQPQVAQSVLSAAQLGFDMDYGVGGDHPGNLHVGGGNLFGPDTPPYDIGYAALIRHDVIHDILEGLRGPVDETDSSEYKKLTPDPLEDDSAQSPVTVNPWARQLAVAWNPSDNDQGAEIPGTGEYIDFWFVGVTPRLTIYSPQSAPDSDLDGVPNGSDNAYLSDNPTQVDTDGDHYGNMADGDFNNDGVIDSLDYSILSTDMGLSGTDTDMDGDGTVTGADKSIFLLIYGEYEPYY